MAKIIIHIGKGVTEFEAAIAVGRVISEGRVSANATQFCSASRLSMRSGKDLYIFSGRTSTGTDSFNVERDTTQREAPPEDNLLTLPVPGMRQ
jgi:hypothetical protein